MPPSEPSLYAAMAADQFGHGFAGAVFVIYLSLLVNPASPARNTLPVGLRLPAAAAARGASGAMQVRLGYDGFFALTGAMSLASLVILPFALRARPRA